MRKIHFVFLITVLIIAFSPRLFSQLQININIESQPIWGPVGYDAVQYYYIPEIDTYYYVPEHQFIYMQKGQWKKSSNLPHRYANYNLYRCYKVVINEDRPYRRNKDYRAKYISYKDKHDQHSIRDSRDSKYYVNKDHPEHNNWTKQQKGNNGNNGKKSNVSKHKRN